MTSEDSRGVGVSRKASYEATVVIEAQTRRPRNAGGRSSALDRFGPRCLSHPLGKRGRGWMHQRGHDNPPPQQGPDMILTWVQVLQADQPVPSMPLRVPPGSSRLLPGHPFSSHRMQALTPPLPCPGPGTVPNPWAWAQAPEPRPELSREAARRP